MTFLIDSYCFTTSNYCGSLVYERENKLKYALNVMGCRTLPYWLGTLCFDYVMFLIPTLIFYILTICFDILLFKVYGGLLMGMIVTFGFSYITISYLMSFMF